MPCENQQSYTNKEKEQIDEGSYQINKMNQELIIRNLNNKMKRALSRISNKITSDGFMQFEDKGS